MAPLDALADPTLDPPALNERGRVELLSPGREATILLTTGEYQWLPNGGSREVEKPRKVKFHAHRAEITLEDWWLLAQHPAFTGETEPRIVFLADEGRYIDTDSTGVQVVDGAINSGTRKRTPPPIQGWDNLTYAQLRKFIAEGVITSPLDALIYERGHRNREGILQLLIAAAAGAELPTVRKMRGADASRAAREAGEKGQDPVASAQEAVAQADPEPEPAPRMAESDEEIEAEIRAALEAGGELDGDPIAEDADEPIPGEGVQ